GRVGYAGCSCGLLVVGRGIGPRRAPWANSTTVRHATRRVCGPGLTIRARHRPTGARPPHRARDRLYCRQSDTVVRPAWQARVGCRRVRRTTIHGDKQMASSLFPDPLQMWRDALTKLENDANAMAAGRMKTPEIMRSLQQATAVSAGMQQAFEKVVEGYLRRANLPS